MKNIRFKDIGNYTLTPLSYYIKKFNSNFYMGLHNHGYFEIMYAKTGAFHVEIATNPNNSEEFFTVTVNQGSFIFLDSYLFHRLKISQDATIYNIELEPTLPENNNPFNVNAVLPINYSALLTKTQLSIIANNTNGYMVVPNLSNVDSTMHNLILLLTKQANRLEDACSIRLALFSFFNEISKSLALFKDNDAYFTRKIYIYIKNHLNQKITLEQIANNVGYHKAYLTSQFKKLTGKTVMQLVCSMRISKSLQLLRDTNLSISEISKQVGFSSYTQMVYSFQKIVGISPSNCRKHFINDEIAHSSNKHQSTSVRISPEDYLLDDETFYSAYYKKDLHTTAEDILKKY